MTSDIPLNAGRFEALVKALLAAFPTVQALTHMVRFKLELNLDEITAGNLSERTFALVRWAESRGRVRALIEGAHAENPTNETLAAFVRMLGAEFSPQNVALRAAAPEHGVPWTREAVFDALVKLLPGQFDTVLFRMALPMQYLPSPTATLAERAIGLVRLVEQQGRIAELGAVLEQMGVR